MINFIVLIILSVFSTGIMSYISMATPIGPWIGPTLVIFASLFFNLFYKNFSVNSTALTVIGSSIGGILATALGFSLPTLFFLDSNLFNGWINNPAFFITFIFALSLSASLFGFWITNVIENKFLFEQELSFPISQIIHKMIIAQNQLQKAKELMIGFVTTLFFCIFQDGIFKFKGLFPKSLTIVNSLSFGFLKIPAIKIEMFPTYWAIGYITGHIIAIPLLVGALSKIFIVDSINHLFFENISSTSFMLAFCSGIVLFGAFFGFIDMPKIILNSMKSTFNERNTKLSGWAIPVLINSSSNFFKKEYIQPLLLILILNFSFLNYFNFSILNQIYLLFFTFICTYQVTNIAAKIGLAQLGRFATFVMVPAIFLFNLNFIQITIIATFVEICSGVATDLLFGRKIAHLSNIPINLIKKYQLIGIIISSLASGLIFWLLIKHFTLGSVELFAQKGQSRALLINAISFDKYVLILGFIFGYILKKININSMLVLGGLLMPLDISLGLMIGGIISYLVKDREQFTPFWSGVFASHSLWMIIQAIVK